jgi:hypothetical protein
MEKTWKYSQGRCEAIRREIFIKFRYILGLLRHYRALHLNLLFIQANPASAAFPNNKLFSLLKRKSIVKKLSKNIIWGFCGSAIEKNR